MFQVPLAPHQKKAVAELHNGSILCGGVGTGKSRVAMQYYVEKEAPKDVYVITTAKKRDSLDWVSEGVAHGVGVAADATFHGTLKVDSWNNLWRYVDVENAFFIFDEQRLVGSGAWVKVFYKIAKKNNWIMLSATPGDTWLDYIPVFVANGLYKNKTEFQREHVIYSRYSKFPKVERYIGVGRLVRHRNNLLVDMPYDRHTTRVIHDVDVEYDIELYDKVVKQRWNPFESRPLRDVAELFSVMRKVVNTDASRLEAVRSLITQHPKLIVFYNFDYELEILRTLANPTESRKTECLINGSDSRNSSKTSSTSSLASGKKSSSRSSITSLSDHESSSRTDETSSEKPTTRLSKSQFETRDTSRLLTTEPTLLSTETSTSKSSPSSTPTFENDSELVIAEWNGHKHDAIPTSARWVYLVQYTAGAEGWNCTETDTCVFFSLNYSYRIFEQCQGRIERMDTPFFYLHYYVLKSKASIDKMIWAVVKKKEKFNEPRSEASLLKALSGVQK